MANKEYRIIYFTCKSSFEKDINKAASSGYIVKELTRDAHKNPVALMERELRDD